MDPREYLQQCRDSYVCVSLRNGDLYYGLLTGTDMYMNLSMVNVVVWSGSDAEQKKIPTVCLRGNMVRFVSMPDSIAQAVQDRRHEAIQAQKDKMMETRGGQGGDRRFNDRGGGRGRGRGRGRGGGNRGGRSGFVPRENYNNPDHFE